MKRRRRIFHASGWETLIDPRQIDVSIYIRSIYFLFILYILSINTKDGLIYMQLAVEFAKECERLIDQYVQRVTDHVLFKVGKCWPLSQAYNTTSAVICQQIFWPFVSFFSQSILQDKSICLSLKK